MLSVGCGFLVQFIFDIFGGLKHMRWTYVEYIYLMILELHFDKTSKVYFYTSSKFLHNLQSFSMQQVCQIQFENN
jgi:hypothetical protein